MAAQLTFTKGLARRSLASCTARATSSLPVPLSPVISTRAPVGPTRRTCSRIACTGMDSPTISARLFTLSRSARTSRPRSRRSSALRMATQQALLAERLLDEVEGAVARGLDRGGDGAVAADHDHRQLGVVLAQPPQHLDAVHARQPHVDHRHIGTLGLAALEAVLAALGHVHREALGGQHHGERAADVPLIIDDQDPGTHAAPSSVADVAATAAVSGRSTVNAAP